MPDDEGRTPVERETEEPSTKEKAAQEDGGGPGPGGDLWPVPQKLYQL
ncbi:hypothetical protein ACFLUU_07345 [Chloroflexota bacterium]